MTKSFAQESLPVENRAVPENSGLKKKRPSEAKSLQFFSSGILRRVSMSEQ
jgi:hypothetical protein